MNLLEPSEPVQTCTGIARPLPLPVGRNKKPNFRPLILVQDKENGVCEEDALMAPCEIAVHTLDTYSKPLHMLANIVGDEAYSLMHAAFLYVSFKPEGSISMSISLLLGSRVVEASRCMRVPL